jgi:hypothetical protein
VFPHPSGHAKKKDKLLTMDASEITYEMVAKKLREIVTSRGRKGTDKHEQVGLVLWNRVWRAAGGRHGSSLDEGCFLFEPCVQACCEKLGLQSSGVTSSRGRKGHKCAQAGLKR